MKISLSTHEARRLKETKALATNWPLEVWVIHEPGEPYNSIAQVELFREKHRWSAWTGSIINNKIRTLANELTEKRNVV